MSLIDRCRQRCRNTEEDEGFTLIELLVVLLIIGILLAIAIPTFLSVTKGANGTAAQSNLQTALTGADTFYTDGDQSYVGVDGPNSVAAAAGTSDLSQINTGLVYVSGANSQPSTASHTVSVDVLASGQALEMTAWAPGQNDCWGILDIKSTQASPGLLGQTATGTYYYVKRATSSAACIAGTVGSSAISQSSFPSP